MPTADGLFAHLPEDEDPQDDSGDAGNEPADHVGDIHPDRIVHWRNSRGVFVPTPHDSADQDDA